MALSIAPHQSKLCVYVVIFESDGEQVARYVYPSRTPQQALVMALEAWYDEAGYEMAP